MQTLGTLIEERLLRLLKVIEQGLLDGYKLGLGLLPVFGLTRDEGDERIECRNALLQGWRSPR
jgi:hypothetical protein